jgi:hypothetical protein
MKDIYKGFCKKDPDEIKSIWDHGLITFDANVLLNLYRYSEETRSQILKLIKMLSSKTFLTHQAGLEFHRNRFEVIAEQEKIHKDFLESVKKIEEDLSTTSKHPFITDKLYKKLSGTLKEVRDEINASQIFYTSLIAEDQIYSELNKLFKKGVEGRFTGEERSKIIEEGKKRYENKIPPGYTDEKNKEGERSFGDLFLWKQVIVKAKNEKKPIILITDEKKRDWWWKLKDDRLIGPRQELVDEIWDEAGVEFHMYSTQKFIEYGLTYFNQKSNPKALEEIKEVQLQSNFQENFMNEVMTRLSTRDYGSIAPRAYGPISQRGLFPDMQPPSGSKDELIFQRQAIQDKIQRDLRELEVIKNTTDGDSDTVYRISVLEHKLAEYNSNLRWIADRLERIERN